MKVNFEKLDNFDIGMLEKVKVITTAPHLKKILYVKNGNSEARIRNVDKDHFKDLRTGEIKKKKHTKRRIENKLSARNTRNYIIDVINTNVTDVDKGKLITLTYGYEMTDTKVFYEDICLFVKNFNYRYKSMGNIKICIPQLRNVYHAHIIFLWNDIAPNIPYNEVRKIWGKGNVDVQELWGDVDNLGVYLSSEFYDVPLEEMKKYNIPYNERDVKRVDVINGKKLDEPRYFVKNGILNLVPTGFRICRPSRNLKKPTVEEMKYYEAIKNEVGDISPTYKSSLKLTLDDKDKGWTNFIVKEYYNLKRTSSYNGPNEEYLEVLNQIKKYKRDDERSLKMYEQSKTTDPDNFDF